MQERVNRMQAKPAIVVMGVCGVGKSLIADRIARHLEVDMVEADDFHSAANRQKMAQGIALSDADRTPWLNTVAETALEHCTNGEGVVVACSSLRRSYRDLLKGVLNPCVFVHLTGERALIEQRLTERKDHFVGKALLESQLKTLEPLQAGEPGFPIDISLAVDEVVEGALEGLRKNLPDATVLRPKENSIQNGG